MCFKTRTYPRSVDFRKRIARRVLVQNLIRRFDRVIQQTEGRRECSAVDRTDLRNGLHDPESVVEL